MKHRILIQILTYVLLFIEVIPQALAEIPPAKLIQSTQSIFNLTWKNQESPVQILRTKAGKAYARATFSGTYDRSNWTLSANRRMIKKFEAASPDIKLEVILTGPSTPIELTAIGPYGDIEKGKIEIEWDGFYAILPKDPEFSSNIIQENKKNWKAQMGFGLTHLNYEQTRAPQVSEKAFTLKGGILRSLNSKWDIAGSGYWNTFLINHKPDPYSISLYGLNGRVGFQVPQVRFPWAMKFMFGWYYLSRLQSQGGIGFSGVNGPQLFPMLSYTLPSQASIGSYIKFSPVSDRFKVLQLSSYELAGGLSFFPSKKILFQQPIGFTLDYSKSKVELIYGQFKLSTISLGLTTQVSW